LPGKNIRRLRIARGLTQKQLAREAGCTDSHITQIEGGQVNPSLKRLRMIAGVLKVPVAKLLEEENESGEE